MSLDVNNKWICTFHTGIFHSSKSQKVKNAVLIEYHGDSGMN